MATEISFDAALRDVHSSNPRARNIAVRNLAQGLLDDLGRPSPSWGAAQAHARGEEVVDALRNALEIEGDPSAQGLALVGLAQLGTPEAMDTALAWLDADDPQGGEAPAAKPSREAAAQQAGMAFLRECAIISLGLLGRAAPNFGPQADQGRQVIARCRKILSEALASEHADVRFQSAMSLAELGDGDPQTQVDVQAQLVAALESETEPEVMRNQVAALNTFDPPSAASIEARLALITGEHAEGEAAFRAAVGLSAARDLRAGPRLVHALGYPAQRDRALEALAALGPDAPADATPIARRLAQAWLTPKVTRVRAAYALARMTPEEGKALLARMSRSLRPAVRAAVRDATVALQTLAERETPS